MGAIIGIHLLMILGVAIAVVVLYLVRRRNTEGKYSTGRRASEKKEYGMGKYQTCTVIMHDEIIIEVSSCTIHDEIMYRYHHACTILFLITQTTSHIWL